GYSSLQLIMENYDLTVLDSMTADDLRARPGGDEAVVRARSMIGRATYVWGACNAQARQFDCSGFVSWCLTGKSVRLGTTDTFITWRPALFPQPGDVCVYTGAQYAGGGHCGIYIGVSDGVPMMIDCSDGVDVRPVDGKMSYRRYP
ncbi:MAG: C40 family peptidase, partial [Coriobacteriales bacterium]|nr:C40 family peptidase [Coriobacteriales bacterium]